ncbi:hypothetical protein AZE42_10482 [Rhizopogon vesiculosus]|uniref:Uncharacterized protein n=1 Tax=Rhizopogon vesiculosus TaxID=180088 RepID=A0A1J8Q7C3_9AGAM|nr:hypothetical protein AZE42_10482 [Rhizopogon vesiculosus]
MSATYEKSEELGHKQSPESPTTLESDIPDGGFQAWATVFGCFLMQFCGFGKITDTFYLLESIKISTREFI